MGSGDGVSGVKKLVMQGGVQHCVVISVAKHAVDLVGDFRGINVDSIVFQNLLNSNNLDNHYCLKFV